jgi:hypothetical protein
MFEKDNSIKLSFFDIIETNWVKNKIKYDLFFIIRMILIIDKKNLDVNYLDLNIQKYI